MSEQQLRVLLVDNETSFRESLVEYLRQTRGYHVETAASDEEALARIKKARGRYDVALIDHLLMQGPDREPEPLGGRLMSEIKAQNANAEFILFTGPGLDLGVEALRAGAFHYICKPFTPKGLAILIEHVAEHRQLKEVAREKEVLERLMETSTALLSGQGLQNVLDTILRGVQAIGFDRVRLYLLSDDRQFMVGHAQVGMETEFVGLEIPVGTDIYVQTLLADPRSHVFECEDNKLLPHEQQLAKEEVNQWACVPLVLHGEVVGKLSMDNKFCRRPIVETELAPLTLFAAQAAAAIENARLVTKAQDATREAEQRARNLAAIQQISTAMSSLLDLDTILEATCRAAVELFDVHHSGLVIFEPGYESGRVVAEYPDLGTRGVEIPVRGVSAEEQLIASKEPLVLPDISGQSSLGPVADIFEEFNIRSILIVPVVSRGRVLGSFSLDAIGRSRTFTDDEILLCKVFAAQVAVAVENAQLFTEIKQHAAQLETLRQATLAITSPLGRDTLLRTIIQQAVMLLGAKTGGILEYCPECDELTIIEGDSSSEGVLTRTFEVAKDMARRLLQSKEPFLIIGDHGRWPEKVPVHTDQRSPGALIEVPLRWQKRITGVLCVVGKVGQKFTVKDADLLRLFADHAAIGLVNAELMASDTDKLRRLEKLSLTISEIMGNLGTMSLDERLDLITGHATEILDAESCGIFLVKRSGFLSLEAGYGHREGGFKKGKELAIRSGPRTGLTGHIAYEGKLFNARGDDLTDHFAVRGEEPIHTDSGHCYSLLAIPLKKASDCEEKLVGLLRVDNKKDKKGRLRPTVGFDQEDEWLLSLFANAVVVAIEGAELVAQLSEQKDHWARLIVSSPNGVIAIDRHGIVTGFSEQAQEVLKYHPEEVLGRPVNFLYDDPEEPHRVGKLLYAMPDGRLTNYETLVRSKEGERIPIRLAATWLCDAQGRQIGSVGYFEDLRFIKETERRLALLLKASNIVAQAKNLTHGLQSLAEMMVTLLNTTFCRIFLLDESQQFLVAKAVYPIPRSDDGLDWKSGLGERTAVAEWPKMSEFLTEGAPTVLRIDGKRSRILLTEWSHRLGLKEDIQSLFVIPLRTRNRAVGLLDLGELRGWEQAPFSEGKKELAIAIADQTTVLIDRLRLHEITDRRRQLLTALDEASRHIRAEKGTSKLLQEVVRLAVELAGCSAGGLYINHPQLKMLELRTVYELSTESIGSQLSHAEGLVGLVARIGESRIVHAYSEWPHREAILEPYGFKTVVGVPLKKVGEVEAVLFVGDSTSLHQFTETDLEILERFAVQASLALQTSRLMDQEHRTFAQLTILHRISDYIQTVGDLDKMFHVVLTSVTAGYGLGFNRAALFLLDEAQEKLTGRMGIGHLDEAKAREDWERDQQRGGYDFDRYLELLEQEALPLTPIGERIGELRLPLASADSEAFSRAVLEQHWMLVTQDELDRLPDSFIEAFEPALPLAVIPLVSRGQVIGILVADNKFTRSPITPEDIELLLTFANTAAIAIDNTQLFHEAKAARERLRAFYKASNALVSTQDPGQVLRDTVEQARVAAGAAWVSVILIDEMGRARNLVIAGTDKQFDISDVIRPNGLTMQVMRTGKAEIVEDTSKQRDRVNPSMFRDGIAAALCLPLSLQGKRAGVMWFHYNESRHFPDFEIDAQQLYVNQAAIAYDSARRMQELTHMRRAAEALAGAASVPEVLQQIVKSAREVLDGDSSVIWSYDDVRHTFFPDELVTDGIAPELVEQFRHVELRPDGTAETVMRLGWIGVTNIDDPQYTTLGPSSRGLRGEIGVEAFQGIALRVGDETLGVLYVNYKQPRSFGEKERRTLETFATHAALALKKARLLEQLRKARDVAKVVAGVSILEDLEQTLRSIVKGTQDVLGCDAVSLYTYDQTTDKLGYPPDMIGVWYPERATRLPEVPRNSIVFKMLKRDKPYFVNNTSTDSLFENLRFVVDEKVKSCVAMPLKVGDRRVGVMFVNYRSLHRFTGEELTNIELFAYQAAVAICNAQLYEQVRKRARALEALHEAGSAVTSTLALDETLNHIAEQAWRLAEPEGERRTQFSHIALVDGRKLRLAAAFPQGHLRGLQAKVSEIDLDGDDRTGITGRVAKTGQSQLIGDVTQDPDFIEYDSETRSELAVPIKVGEQVIGVINVEHPEHNAFDEEDRKALESLAAQAATAIQNARQLLLREGLLQAGEVVTAEGELFPALEIIAKKVKETIGCDLVSLYTYNQGKREISYPSVVVGDLYKPREQADWQLVSQEKKVRISLLEEDSVIEKLLEHGCSRFAPRSAKDSILGAGNFVAREEVRSSAGVPLKIGEEVVGILFVNYRSAHHFEDEERQAIELFAVQAALAIQSARRYEELRRIKGLVGTKTAVDWMKMVSTAWGHGIRREVGTALGHVQFLHRLLSKREPEQETKKELDLLENVIKRIKEIPIIAPLSYEDAVGSVQINDLVKKYLERRWQHVRYKPVALCLDLQGDLDSTATVRTSREWLRRALEILVDNSVQAMLEMDRPEKQLTVTTRHIGGQVEISVKDTGPGIPKGILERLFKERIEKPAGSAGAGIGLILSRTIVQTYGGDIRMEPPDDGGTNMIITLPVEDCGRSPAVK